MAEREGFEPSLGVYSLKRFSKGTVPGPVARNQQLTGGWQPRFRATIACSGTTVPQLFPNYFLVFPHLPTFPHIDV